jgi:hypothetical protein
MRALPPQGERPTGWVAFGSGWVGPAVVVSMFVVLLYVPAHNPSTSGIDGLIAAMAILYVLGLSLTTPRLLRGVILRFGGSHDPIVLLGRGPDALTAESIRARWRLAAVAVSTVTSLAATFVAARLTVTADPASYQHAVASLALGVNLAIAAGSLVPAPGFTGWALLLGLLDASGVKPDRRVGRAARMAQFVGVPIMLTLGVAAALFGYPMFLVIGFVFALITWTQSTVVVGQDATARFLAGHRAADLVRPIINHVDPEETLDGLLARSRANRVVTIVEVDGSVLGAIGPRQIAGRASGSHGDRCREVMVPIAALRPLAGSSPAADLLPRLGGYGFALVTGPDGLGYVEVSDLATQIRIWIGLRERGVARQLGRRQDEASIHAEGGGTIVE